MGRCPLPCPTTSMCSFSHPAAAFARVRPKRSWRRRRAQASISPARAATAPAAAASAGCAKAALSTASNGPGCCPRKRHKDGSCRAWPMRVRTWWSNAEGRRGSVVARAIGAARHVLVLAVGDGLGLGVRAVPDRVRALLVRAFPALCAAFSLGQGLWLGRTSEEFHAATLGTRSARDCRTPARAVSALRLQAWNGSAAVA
jgi:hypothetical protein